MLKRSLFGLFFCFAVAAAIAQDSFDTTIFLNEISINTYRFEQFSEGSKRQKIDSLSKSNYANSSVAEALNNLSNIYLKSYGVSGNTSISLRGTSASHTAILWNGINLQDPLNGGSTIELIPLQAMDELIVQYGGSGALYGSGAIGGAILMQSKAPFRTGLKAGIQMGIGSFGHYFGQASLQKGGKKAAASLRVFYRQAKNDFTFTNTAQFGHPEMTLDHAAFQYIGISHDSRLLITDNQQINLHVWLQKSERELPPNMTSLISKQSQSDAALRFSADYSLSKNKVDFMSRVGLLSSKLNFNDSLSGIFAEHLSKSAILETELNYRIRANHLANFGIHDRIDWGKSDNYSQINQRNNLAFLLNYKIWNPRKTITINGSIRQELIEKKWSQATPVLGINYQLSSAIQLSAKVAKTYRIPTFNDLYWYGGFARGNPDLMPESASSQDFALYFSKSDQYNKINISISVFNTYVKDLILWVPIEGIWMPKNQKEVWTRGLESDFGFEKILGKSKIKLDLHYTYNPSTVEKKAENESDAILGKQLIYTPLQQAKALFSIQSPFGSLSIEQILVGKRYTSADNSSELDAYQLTNLVLNCSYFQHFGIYFRLNNVFDQDYQSMENYVLPGRNYQLSIHYNIH
ncbi:MAG: TonB-dependent receptor [Bacteroidales bacterium]|nr:TonB-dependent receptor [Bacteroidales bacterium]